MITGRSPTREKWPERFIWGGLFITLLLHSTGRYVVVIADPAIPSRSIVLNCKRIPHYARNNGALCWLLRLTTSVSREEERSQHDLSFLRSTSDSSTVLPRRGHRASLTSPPRQLNVHRENKTGYKYIYIFFCEYRSRSRMMDRGWTRNGRVTGRRWNNT